MKNVCIFKVIAPRASPDVTISNSVQEILPEKSSEKVTEVWKWKKTWFIIINITSEKKIIE